MRKRTVIMLLLVATLLLYACGSSSSSIAASSVASESADESADSTVAESEPASEAIVEEVVEEEPEPREGNFRVGFWGDDAETIKKYETADFMGDGDNGLVYTGKVGGQPANIVYYFDEDGVLYKGGYMLTEKHLQGSTYIGVYNVLKDALISKYGTPDYDEVGELSHLAGYTDEGTALELGYTLYYADWTLDDTHIRIALGNNDEIFIALEYKDINHEEVINTDGL